MEASKNNYPLAAFRDAWGRGNIDPRSFNGIVQRRVVDSGGAIPAKDNIIVCLGMCVDVNVLRVRRKWVLKSEFTELLVIAIAKSTFVSP